MKSLKCYDFRAMIDDEEKTIIRYMRGKKDGKDTPENRKSVQKLASKIIPKTLKTRLVPVFAK